MVHLIHFFQNIVHRFLIIYCSQSHSDLPYFVRFKLHRHLILLLFPQFSQSLFRKLTSTQESLWINCSFIRLFITWSWIVVSYFAPCLMLLNETSYNRRLHACDQAPTPIPILDIRSLTNRIVQRNRNSPLNIISVMFKELSECSRKYLQTGCKTYRPDFSFCWMLLNAYFVTSRFGLLNVNDFSFINFILLNTYLKLLNINLILLKTDLELLNI